MSADMEDYEELVNREIGRLDASEPTLEAAPGTHTASRGVSGAPSGAVLGGVGAALLAFVVGRFGLLPDSVVIGACAGVAVVALLRMALRRT